MYDVEANKNADRMEQELKDRSRSLGRDQLSQMGTRSERGGYAGSPLGKAGLGMGVDSMPNLGGIDPKIRFGDSFTTEKRDGTLKLIKESQNKAMQHDLDARFDNQDRMINYLLSQIQGVETTVSSR